MDKKKSPFPSFLLKMKQFLKEQKYEQIISESKEFMKDNFLTMKEENKLKSVLKIATLEYLNSLEEVDYSKMSRERLLNEIFKSTIINVFAKSEFVEKVGVSGTDQELDYLLVQLKNPKWIPIEVINILNVIAKCFPSFEGRVTFWHKRNKKYVVKSIVEYRQSKKANGFYSNLEKSIEEQLFKEPSLVDAAKEITRDFYVDCYGFPPSTISPEELAQHIVKEIRESLNSAHSKLKN
ncbi:MAG: DUF3196 family protein [Malacoplasma sp.]|nr:DUF3196 family protein [Malacoplasma sp.]